MRLGGFPSSMSLAIWEKKDIMHYFSFFQLLEA
jgi:hypothetical protein